MKKKIISGILCAVMAVSTFAGLSIVEVKADDKNTIVVWMKKDLTDVANNMFRERCEKFAEENDVKVEVELIAYEDFIQNGQLQLNLETFLILAILDIRKWVSITTREYLKI